ncbi:MAG: hypothetical protein KatS3mg079_326 [Caloramator sp.]|nr:MAG: hypothetical protein KatS3mg079_326 [Caloramator sp.]
MFGGFTERSQKVLNLAAEEAKKLGHNFIGTEHILLGIVREGGYASKLLLEYGIDTNRLKQEIINIEGQGEMDFFLNQIELTPRTKRLIEVAKGEASSLNHNFIAPEHLLLSTYKGRRRCGM